MLSSLLLLPSSEIDLHESYEESRLKNVYSSILREGYLRHPLSVTRMKNGRYLLIDGAHRFQALRLAGCMHMPVHVINPEEMQMSTWVHEIKIGAWLQELRLNTLYKWHSESNAEKWMAIIFDENGNKQWIAPVKQMLSLPERLSYWNTIVNSYVNYTVVRRLSSYSEESILPGYVRFQYPAWTMDEIENVIAMGLVLPPGSTQCIVQKRLLNLGIPLSFLINQEEPTDEWEQLKIQWSNSLRYYPGSVYLYDGDYIQC